MKWISTRVKLPPKYEKVLIISGNWTGHPHSEQSVVKDVFMAVRIEDSKWLNSDDPKPNFKIFKTDHDEVEPDGIVNYWMPLPEHPEKD